MYPITLKVDAGTCVVVGGGTVAARKVDALLAARASVLVVSPELCHPLKARYTAGEIKYRPRGFEPADLDGALLTIAATDAADVNQAVFEAARERGILVNVVDQPELCTFYVPGLVRRGDVTIAVSTGGSSPALARRIREELEDHIGPEYGALARLLAGMRPRVIEGVADEADRRELWREMLASDALSLLAEGRRDEAMHALEDVLKRFA